MVQYGQTDIFNSTSNLREVTFIGWVVDKCQLANCNFLFASAFWKFS